ncbi:hypothetical protein FRC12_012416 [Ceratobasidium sp. 428]|nr:hypothetical protein FRC12_012416 [Ceratobasidium sp. 428]
MGHSDSVRSVSFSPDSAYIVSGSGDRTLRIWDVHAGQMVGRPLRGHFGSVIAAVYSPDGARIVSGSSDCTVCIWDAHTGQMVGWPLLGHTGEILSVSYSPDGAYIASGSSDGTIRIWDAPTRQAAVLPLSCVNGRVHSVAFSPDGTRVVSGHHDGSIRVWHLYTRQVISDWTQLNRVSSSQTMESCPCSVCTSSIDWDPWKYREDGWIVNERDELLIWVPHSLGSSVVHPHNSIVISRHGTLKLDFGGARLGTEWQRCYTA